MSGASDFVWTLPRALGAALTTVLAVFLLLVVLTPLTIGLGWYTGEASLRSFSHVRDTYRLAYDDINALQALQGNACITIQARRAATDAAVREQRTTQLIAIEQTYNRTAAEYDAYMSDHFRGKIIRPGDLPMPAPPLDLSGCAA